MIVPIVIGAFGTITKRLSKGLEDLEAGRRVETIQMTALLRTARILRRVLETWGDLLSIKLQSKTDFNIQTDHLIPARRPDLVIIKKKRICKIVDFAVPADHRINLKESKKKDKYLYLARELKKLWNMKVTIVPIVIGVLGTITEGLLKGLEDLEVWRTGRDYPNDSIAKNGQNPETSPGDLRRLAVTYRTLHSYNLIWAVCHLFPQRWQTLNVQSRETIGQEDHVICLQLRRRAKIQVLRLEPLIRRFFL